MFCVLKKADVLRFYRCFHELSVTVAIRKLMPRFSCLPVLQALLWAPSPRFWFLCSSFALGGLATKGLRLPSLKSDVHSTCWFFKQLCPQKNQDKPLTLSSRRNWGQGRGVGGGGYGARAIRLCFSVSLFLFLSLPHYLSISVFSQVFFFFSFQFFYHLLNRAQT